MDVPLDTLGHPMPPPCPPCFISRLPQREFGEYWRKYAREPVPPLPWGPRPA